jgi:hypothetical protein
MAISYMVAERSVEYYDEHKPKLFRLGIDYMTNIATKDYYPSISEYIEQTNKRLKSFPKNAKMYAVYVLDDHTVLLTPEGKGDKLTLLLENASNLAEERVIFILQK